ncbi:VOC family protein [Sphingomonas alpina]|uniref:VOC family protein n=1 Tax=Sphingomonas alpina TaxID=653931 RepID=A0A7H0LDN0_9SPHN|nr:VOC family protein [Sphingomonas alpina]QNQ07783.1 VOC family protein [Sphingomonas alpina]
MLNKVAFTMYPITDVDRARSFYETTLGLTIGSNAGDGRWIEYDLPGGGCLALTTLTKASPGSDSGGMIAFEVDDLDALTTRLESDGVTFVSDLIHSPVCRMRICLDSEGNRLMLHQLKAR